MAFGPRTVAIFELGPGMQGGAVVHEHGVALFQAQAVGVIPGAGIEIVQRRDFQVTERPALGMSRVL